MGVPEISGLYREPPRSDEASAADAKYALELAFDLAPVSMAVLDEDRGFRMVNRAYCQLVGYPRRELLELRLPDVTHPEDHWLDRDWLEYVHDSDAGTVSQKKRLVTRNGETVWVTHDSRKSALGSDSPLFSVSTFRRMSEDHQVRAERAAGDVWIERIANALLLDNFTLHGQPIIDLATGQVNQHELLLRMDLGGRKHRLIMPGEFMPPAEKYDLVDQIDQWVVGRALEIARDRTVTVNLSGSTISRMDRIEQIEQTVKESATPAGNLIFEITETAVIRNLQAATAFVERLHELGCQFALDDFGTGFGSFSYLKRLPVDYLKIDMDFVRDLVSEEANQRVVRSIVGTAELFDIATIAEGVEDGATLELLREFGVDFAQGYYIGRPTTIGG